MNLLGLGLAAAGVSASGLADAQKVIGSKTPTDNISQAISNALCRSYFS